MGEKENNNNNIAFVGPLPPPVGGVGVMNESFQKVVGERWNVLQYNTSNGGTNEDLYRKKNLKNLFNFIKSIKGFLKFLNGSKFKVVNVFTTSNTAFIRDSLFIFILWICRKKIIVHFHSKKKGEFFLRPFTIKYTSFIFRFSKKIIVLSEDHYSYFSQYFENSKMMVIENFVDYSLYDCNIDEKKLEFLYVGRLSEKKGFFDLIEAFKILRNKGINVIINILGTPENEETKVLIKQELKKHNLVHNIVLHGNVTGSRKYDFFRNCSIFIFPSHFENSPVVLKEAIAAKMAIICSDIEANKILSANIRNAEFFITGNPLNLSNKIVDLLNNPSQLYTYMHRSEECKIYDKEFAKEKMNNLLSEMSN